MDGAADDRTKSEQRGGGVKKMCLSIKLLSLRCVSGGISSENIYQQASGIGGPRLQRLHLWPCREFRSKGEDVRMRCIEVMVEKN